MRARAVIVAYIFGKLTVTLRGGIRADSMGFRALIVGRSYIVQASQ